jgi:hypothetical protein
MVMLRLRFAISNCEPVFAEVGQELVSPLRKPNIAQAEVMVSPDADSLCLGQQTARFLNPLPRLDNVTEDNDPIHLLLAKPVQSDPQEVDPFVDVGDEAETHQSRSVIGSGKTIGIMQVAGLDASEHQPVTSDPRTNIAKRSP